MAKMSLSTAMSPILVVLAAGGSHNPYSRQRGRSSGHLLAYRLYFAIAASVFIFLAVPRILVVGCRASSIDNHLMTADDIDRIRRHTIWTVCTLASGAVGIYFGATDVWRKIASAWMDASGDSFVASRAIWKFALLDIAGFTYLLLDMSSYLLARWERFTLCFNADAWRQRSLHDMLFDCSRPIGKFAESAWKQFLLMALAMYALGVTEALDGLRRNVNRQNESLHETETIRCLSEDHRKLIAVVKVMDKSLATFIALQLISVVPMATITCYLLITDEPLPHDAMNLIHIALELLMVFLLLVPLAEINVAHSHLFQAFSQGRGRSTANAIASKHIQSADAEDDHPPLSRPSTVSCGKSEWRKQMGVARRFCAQLRQDVGVTALRSFIIKRMTFVNIFSSVVVYLVILVEIPTNLSDHHAADLGALNSTVGAGTFRDMFNLTDGRYFE